MKFKHLHIYLILILGIFSGINGYANAEPRKGSRLYIKTNTVKKHLALNKFSKPVATSLDIKPAKTVNLYFSNYLISRNLTKPLVKETAVKVTTVSEKVTSKSNAENAPEVEPGEKLFMAEGINISNIYPNPADEAGYFDYNISGNNYREVKVDFFNVLGSPINLSVTLDKSDRKAKVYLKDFENGIYFYQLIADGKTLATKKLLVRHFN